mgnify:CR=1 FL=1
MKPELKEDPLEEIYHDEEVIVIDGLDKAFLGFAERYSFSHPVAVYDRNLCVRLVGEKHGISPEEAEEFFESNILGTWFGDQTPIFITLEPMTHH